MGSLRFILALSVVFSHLNANILIGGGIAVQGFYVVSGFLIALTLHSNQAYKARRNFYINRAIRIFPIYLSVLSLAFFFETYLRFKGIQTGNTFEQLPSFGKAISFLANISLIGQDLVLFMGSSASNLYFSSNFRESEILVYKSMLVPQAWSLSLEIYFYSIAPFLFKSRKTALTLLGTSIAIRLVLIVNGIGTQDPWTYRFFPNEISLFIIGMLAYQIYHKLKEYREFSLQINSLKVVVTLALLIYILGFTLVPWFMVERKVLVIALIILCLPFLLEFQNTFKFDRILGELSYPIYVVHILCIEAGSYWLELPTENLSVQTYLVYLGIIIVSAFVLDLAISKPLESVRRKYRRRNS